MKHYACARIFVSIAERYYRAIDAIWFPNYVGHELGKVCHCFIDQFSKDYNYQDKILHRCDVLNTGDDTGIEACTVVVGIFPFTIHLSSD